ncbi:MAG TPA: DUF2079 domain-containing protein [Anaerolineae bacterium]
MSGAPSAAPAGATIGQRARRRPARPIALPLGRIRWREHAPYLALLLAGAGALTTLALLHHRALGTGYDLGIYDQVVWNLAHGHAFLTTLVYETGGYYDHFEPVLALIAPLYWLWPNAQVLLILQALALALGSLPIYLFALRRLGPIWPGGRGPALLLAAAYLIFPALHSANLNDFHEVALLPPLIGFALYGLLAGRRRVTLIFLILALLVKEDVGVTALSFSLYFLLLAPKGFRRRDGLIMAVAVLIWNLLVLRVLYPAVTHGMPYPFVGRRYSWLGTSPTDALRGLITRPDVALAHLLQPPKPIFLLRLFGPLLFLPLLGWPVIGLAVPILVYLMLSEYPPQWSVQSYYNPPLLPFLFFALVEALILLAGLARRWRSGPRRVLAGLLLLIALGVGYSYYAFAPGPGGRDFQRSDFMVTPRAADAKSLVAGVPADASVSTVFNVVPWLSERAAVYTVLARPIEPPAYMLVENLPDSEGAPLYPYAAPDIWPPVYYEYRTQKTAGTFELQTLARRVTLAPLPEHDPAPQPLSLAAYAWLDGPTAAQAPIVSPGKTARLMLAWRRTGHLTKRYKFFVHLLDPKTRSADGSMNRISQSDHEAGDGRFPTTSWETWTIQGIVLDDQNLEIPTETPSGTYQAWAGVYDKDTGERVILSGTNQGLIYIGDLRIAGAKP